MAKIFEFNANKGSFIDQVSGTTGTNTNGRFKKSEKGTSYFCDGTSYLGSWNLGTFPTQGTIVLMFSRKGGLISPPQHQNILATTDDAENNCIRFENTESALTKIFVRFGNDVATDVFSVIPNFTVGKNYCVIVKWKDNVAYSYYCSENEALTYVASLSSLSTYSPATLPSLVLGRGYNTTRYWNGNIYKVQFFNHFISDVEQNAVVADFMSLKPISKPKRGFIYPKPTDLSHERNTEFTGDEYVQVMEFTDNSGTTSVLRLNDGGDFAVVDWTGNLDFQEISTSTETESNVIPSTVKIFAKNGELTYFRSTDNEYDFDIANLPSSLTYYANYGSNTTSGDIANLPSGMTDYVNSGSNTTSGDIANLPSGLTTYINYGFNTTSGDIANLPSGLTDYNNSGSNQVNTYTSGRTWANNMRRVHNRPASGYGLSVTHISDLLIDLSNVSTWTSDKEIRLLGNNSSMSDTVQGGIWGSYDSGDNPSDLAIALKTLVNTKGVTVDLNGITIPSASGDGTGFPTGFGDWWRS
jgi:hypothetical protein